MCAVRYTKSSYVARYRYYIYYNRQVGIQVIGIDRYNNNNIYVLCTCVTYYRQVHTCVYSYYPTGKYYSTYTQVYNTPVPVCYSQQVRYEQVHILVSYLHMYVRNRYQVLGILFVHTVVQLQVYVLVRRLYVVYTLYHYRSVKVKQVPTLPSIPTYKYVGTYLHTTSFLSPYPSIR